MPLPKHGVYLKNLIPEDSKDIPKSGHEVKRYSLSRDGKLVQGYLKRINEAEYYTEEHAKLVVAFSVHLRMAIGDLGPEELPVFETGDDGNDRLVGTLSLAIPNFKAMQSSGDPEPSEKDKPIVCPDEKTLIKANVARVLFASYRRKNDDLHPGNIGLALLESQVKNNNHQAAIIDLDMFWYVLTSTIKGLRYICGVLVDLPQKAFKLDSEDIREFPCIKPNPCFFPTYAPINKNWNKYYKNQSAFEALQKNPEFHKQTYTAALIELLMYDKVVLKTRLLEYTDDVAFINKMVKFFENEQTELYGILISMPEFRNFLRTNPDLFNEALAHFENDINKKNFSAAAQYTLDGVRSRFLRLWRDCHLHDLAKISSNLRNLLFDTPDEFILVEEKNKVNTNVSIEYPALKTHNKNIPASSSTSSIEPDLAKSILILNEEAEKVQIQNEKISRNSIKSKIYELYQKFHNTCLNYYKTKNTSLNQHDTFIRNIDALYHQLEKIIENYGKICTTTISRDEQLDQIALLLKNFMTNIQLPEHIIKCYPTSAKVARIDKMGLESKAEPTSSILFLAKNPSGFFAPILSNFINTAPDTKPSDNIQENITILIQDWLKSTPRADIEDVLKLAYDGYKPLGDDTLLGMFHYRNLFGTRSIEDWKQIQKFIDDPHLQTSIAVIDAVTSTGGWKSNSYNTILFNIIYQKMLEQYISNPEKVLLHSFIPKLYKAHYKKNFTPLNFSEDEWKKLRSVILVTNKNNVAEQKEEEIIVSPAPMGKVS